MELHRLQHIVSLADAGNFSRAALRAHISQSALSRSIQAAEREFGFALFDRKGSSIAPTAAGKFIIERARALLFESRCLMRDADLYRDGKMGELAFGVGPYAAAVFLRMLLTDVRNQFPEVRTRVAVNNTDSLIAKLKSEELDFYLGDIRNIQSDETLTVTALAQLEAAFYVRPGHPLLALDEVHSAKLLDFGIASVRAPHDVLVAIGRAMGLKNNAPMPMAIELDDLSALKDIGMRTNTVVGCAVAATLEEVAQHHLVRLKVTSMPPLYAMVGIVVLRGRSLSPMAQWALQHLQNQATQQLSGIVP